MRLISEPMELISRQAALDNAWQVMYKDEWHMTQTEQVISVNDIEALPTIDAVPVVRCKDCKYWQQARPNSGNCSMGFSPIAYADDFCSFGERREDG